ncbi:MAG: hypothetical protein ACREOW_11050 [Thermodesulfobacteriota bacterium]
MNLHANLERFPVLKFFSEKFKYKLRAKPPKILFAIRPIYEDREQLLLTLKDAGIEIFSILGLDYSSKNTIYNRLRKLKIDSKIIPTSQIENETKVALKEVISKCQNENKKLLILENGG